MSSGAFLTALLLTLVVVVGPAAAGPRVLDGVQDGLGSRLLDVPYVPQSEALCGGAAAAMVLRYWKTAPVHAEDFAPLVKDSAEGITVGDLTRAVRDRGWRVLAFAGTATDVQSHLVQARPVIALIEDRPGRNHYVVIVAWTDGRIVFHDPAGRPFQVVDEQTFERAWAVTGHIAVLILPDDSTLAPASGGAEPAGAATASAVCGQSVDHAVALARDGNLAAAESLLAIASAACPNDSAGPREMAGVRFVQKRWADSAALAGDAVARDPSDMHAWQLLATARFLAGDPDGALAAWNRRQEPRIDLMRIDGLDRTRYEVVADLVGLPAQTMLTGSDLRRVARRVSELPVARASRVSYSPAASLATVDITIVERPLVPNSWPHLVAAAAQAATGREARLEIASPTGNGELWTVSGRWWERRPRVAFALATPRLWRWTGSWRLDASWEQQTYEVPTTSVGGSSTAEAVLVSDRRRAAVTFGDWASGAVRWELNAALDHWQERGRQLSAGAGVERRFFDDRFAARAHGAAWPRLDQAAAFASGAVMAAFRSASDDAPARWSAQAGLEVVSNAAPRDLWPGADVGYARVPLLRAHPLLVDGVIREGGVGRALLHGTFEFEKRLTARPLVRFGLAAFADIARLAATATGTSRPIDADIGTGLRARLAGSPGFLRLDVARGLRDGNLVLSAAWQAPWPGW